MVMTFHYHLSTFGTGWASTALDRLAGAGCSGVNLFFVLSGFLITGILWDAKADAHYFRTFYARRLLRIFPLYYGALFVGLVLLPWLQPVSDPKYAMTMQHQIWLWTYTSNFYESWSGRALPLYGHFWTLAVEEQFYLIWPFVVLWSGRRTLMAICTVCFLGAFLCRLTLLEVGADPALAVLRLSPCQLDSLVMGAFLALVLRAPDQYDARAWKVSMQRTLIVSTVVIVTFIFFYPELVGGRYFLMALSTSCWSIFFGAGLFSGVMASPKYWLRRLLENRALRVVGRYSYGLYVFHWPLGRLWLAVMERWHSANPGSWLAHPSFFQLGYILLAAGSSLLLAWLSWHLYEKRFLRLKRYFKYDRRSIESAGATLPSGAV